MNRPEPIELENNLGPDAVTGEINRVPWMAYDVDEMDIYIAEKDKEIESLKKKCEAEKSIGATFSENGAELARWVEELRTEIESLKASHYAESVDAGMRERRLRRAFYKACANWAHIAVAFFSSYVTKDRWRRMERKCRAKAEEYKR